MRLDLLLQYRAWALESQFAERVYPLMLSILNREAYDHFNQLNPNRKSYHGMDPAGIMAGDGYVGRTSTKAASGNANDKPKMTAMIPVLGSLTKRGDLSSYGMHDYINAINNANADPNIDSIVLAIESPGGTVDGTPEFVKAVRESQKPVIAFGDGMVASAAYWVASQSKAIIGNVSNYTEFGSIGTLYIHRNWGTYIKNEIGSMEIIRAPQSKDKALVNAIEPLPPDQKDAILAELKMITEDFISAVKAGRGDRLKAKDSQVFTGKMFDLQQSLDYGLIDQVGTLQDAVNYAHELAAADSQPGNTNTNSNSNSMKKWFSSLFSGKAEDKPKEGELSAEDLAEFKAAEQKLADMKKAQDDLKAEVDQLKTAKADLEKKVSDKDAEITELNEKLEEAPAGQATTIVGDKDRGPENEGEKDDFKTSVDAEADNYRQASNVEK